ncbi:hypothetical protein KC131_04960 [Pseudomonas sp. JQ170]|uniref:hypothetical protein n=1 Tax=unclassified Pseudomonas TaxID=196821 RepID=UPI00264CEB30|nr:MULTISPECIES: hypothetical protein [unclassified Pseudomonas]MDN7139987.1 hypothetical protein [Pseudomonas sp. JQ170]WRO78650.1 hypothetical protein U9R80_13570 [Pseudomonas sp. 170C]
MKTSIWVAVLCMAASLPSEAQMLKPIELKDHELANLRGRYVMPGRIISFGVVMSSAWQNAQGELIGATASLQVQQSMFKPQFYVSTFEEKATAAAQPQTASASNSTSTVTSPSPGTGTVTGGAGLSSTEGVTQVVRAAGDFNTAYNNVDINVTKANEAPAVQTQGTALAADTPAVISNGAGSLSVSSSGTGVQMNIVANNNQGSTVQRLAQGGLMQNTTLLGAGNRVINLTSLNVVLRENVPTAGALSGSLDQLKGLRTPGF